VHAGCLEQGSEHLGAASGTVKVDPGVPAASGVVEALRRLAGELRRLRGARTYRELAAGTELSIATLRAALAGKIVPSWKVTTAITAACGGDQAQVRKLWGAACAATGRPVPEDHMPAGSPVPVRGEVTSAAQLADMMRRLQRDHDGRAALRPGVGAELGDDETDVAGETAEAPGVHRRRRPGCGAGDGDVR
jgi:Helix-turn-helix domain